jgi:DNA-binding HxlR family transcriptional regulator
MAERRSGCPVSVSLDLLGDRWSFLLVRDMMVRGYRTFREFQRSGEGIATNILSDRLQKLETGGIVDREPAEDGRSTYYRLTTKGIALAPILLELLIWGAHNEQTDVPCSVIDHMEQNRSAVVAEAYRRWEQRDPTPLLPPFSSQGNSTNARLTKSNSPKGNAKR